MTRKGNPHTLKPFKKGFDPRRNTKGQPKKLPRLVDLLANCLEGELEKIIKALIVKAKKGDVRAAEVLFDRAYGRPKQSLDAATTEIPTPDDMTPEQKLILLEVERKVNETRRNEVIDRLRKIEEGG